MHIDIFTSIHLYTYIYIYTHTYLHACLRVLNRAMFSQIQDDLVEPVPFHVLLTPFIWSGFWLQNVQEPHLKCSHVKGFGICIAFLKTYACSSDPLGILLSDGFTLLLSAQFHELFTPVAVPFFLVTHPPNPFLLCVSPSCVCIGFCFGRFRVFGPNSPHPSLFVCVPLFRMF